jgi:hypothetical protein
MLCDGSCGLFACAVPTKPVTMSVRGPHSVPKLVGIGGHAYLDGDHGDAVLINRQEHFALD